jgi:hypothetical protein
LPFVARLIIRLVIGCAVARTQRDHKVDLCHDIWNGSHCHLLIVTRCAAQCVKFYGEIQKRITDMLKRLLGLDHMQIWEGEVTVALILDREEAIDRIAYFYANPAQDKLVDSIGEFPGFSSWYDFKKSLDKINIEQKEQFPWIRLPSIPALSSSSPTFHEEIQLTRLLQETNKQKHLLIRRPNLWMKCFGIETDAEAKEVNQQILQKHIEKETAAREARGTKPLLGAHRMRTQAIMAAHRPKKHGRKIFVLCSIKHLRMSYIAVTLPPNLYQR